MAKERKSIEEVKKELNKKYGLGSVMVGNDITDVKDVVSTGSLGLDIALGIGGLPMEDHAKTVELFGWESSGKSTICQTIMGNYQKWQATKAKPRKVLLVDGENSLSAKYARALGITLEDLMLIQIDEFAGEGAYDRAEALIETGEIGLVVYDSYNSLLPKKILDGEVGQNAIGLHARMMNTVVAKANTHCVEYNTTSIFIGQLRQNIGVMYGSPDVTQGGNALKFNAHIRLNVSRSTTEANSVMGEGKEKIGNLTKVKVIKNKLANPFRDAEFNILYGYGIDKVSEVLALASEYGMFKKWGITYTDLTNDVKYSEEELTTLIRDNDEFRLDLENKIKTKAYANKVEEVTSPSTDTENPE